MKIIATSFFVPIICFAFACQTKKSKDEKPSDPIAPVANNSPVPIGSHSSPEPSQSIQETGADTVLLSAKSLVLYVTQQFSLEYNGALQRQSYLQNGVWKTYPELNQSIGYLSVHYPNTNKDLIFKIGRYPILATSNPATGVVGLQFEHDAGTMELELWVPDINANALRYSDFSSVGCSYFKIGPE